MILEVLKKQAIVFLRNPQQLMLLISLPLLLIFILSVSLEGMMNGEGSSFQAKVAMVEQADEASQVNDFVKDLENSNLPQEEKMKIAEISKEFSPVKELKENVFGEMSDAIQLDVVPAEDKAAVFEDDSYTSIIEVPKNFTYDILDHVYGDRKDSAHLTLYHNEGEEISVAAVNSIVEAYQEQLTIMMNAMEEGLDIQSLDVDIDSIHAAVTSVDKGRSIQAKEYYTIGMAVMNVLYIASAISSFAFLEKETHVFNRVILANVSGGTYFTGIFISGMVFGCIQLLIIFLFSWLVFGVGWPSLTYFLFITVCLSLAVGGLTVLLTAITYRMNSESFINFFGMICIGFLALIGGSFFPIGDISEFFQMSGNLTPNGAAMSAYLQVLRDGYEANITQHILCLIAFSVLSLIVAIMTFPKRGQIS